MSYCRGWIVAKGVRKPNSVLGVLCRQNFPGFVTLPGREREVGMTWEHYLGAPAPPEVEIDGVLCDTRADMVIRKFWVISLSHNYKSTIAIYCTNRCCLVCRPTTGVRRDTRRTRQRLSKLNVAAYFKIFGTRLGYRLFETTMPRGVLGLIRRSAMMLRWRRSIT